MSYSICKMVSLAKRPKLCKKQLDQNNRVVLCKKPLVKTPNTREMRQFPKSAILRGLQKKHGLQALENGTFGSKVKNAKNVQKNHSTRTLELFFAKKSLEKKIKYLRNSRKISQSAILQRQQSMHGLQAFQDGRFSKSSHFSNTGGVYLSGFLHRTTLMILQYRFSHVFGIFNF